MTWLIFNKFIFSLHFVCFVPRDGNWNELEKSNHNMHANAVNNFIMQNCLALKFPLHFLTYFSSDYYDVYSIK